MIELENVVFRYPGSERGVGPVSFSIKDGERVAITGASGCGKIDPAAIDHGVV